MVKTRTDISVVGEMLDKLIEDFPAAQETASLREWGEAVGKLAEYMAERHKEFHTED